MKNKILIAATRGFTLIEMLLVLAIMSAIIYMSIQYIQQRTTAAQIDRTVLQTQQILNAALAYYVANGSWPAAGTTSPAQLTPTQTLQLYGYLPPPAITNPWGVGGPMNYTIGSLPSSGPPIPPSTSPSGGQYFWVYTPIGDTPSTVAAARVIAGKLPMAMACNNYDQANGTCITQCTCGTTCNMCYVVASVNIPGQNLNNAMAVNYAGVYHSGACVKVPNCPLASMKPEIMVVPVSVTGVFDPITDPCTPAYPGACNAYPINSFTGFATSPAGVHTGPCGGLPYCAQAPLCAAPNGPLQTCSGAISATLPENDPNAQYWRVCLTVSTTKGVVNPPTSQYPWGEVMGTVMVITRCVPSGESNGSLFNVYRND